MEQYELKVLKLCLNINILCLLQKRLIKVHNRKIPADSPLNSYFLSVVLLQVAEHNVCQ